MSAHEQRKSSDNATGLRLAENYLARHGFQRQLALDCFPGHDVAFSVTRIKGRCDF
jgi:hypothetical protein